MRKFSVTQIKNKTVGNILKESREEQNLSLEKAALATRLRPNHLAALEAGDYGKLPGGVYSEKILESYANFLNIDLEGLKKLFKKEISASQRTGGSTFVQKISSKHFIVTPRLVKFFSVAILILLLLVYLGFEINNIFSPPSLLVTSPIDNLTTSDPTIAVAGRAQKEVIVRINDQKIQTDADGNFNESVSLKSGLNVIKISAAKKRSRENIVYRQIILK